MLDKLRDSLEQAGYAIILVCIFAACFFGLSALLGCQSIETTAGNAMKFALTGTADHLADKIGEKVGEYLPPPPAPSSPQGRSEELIALAASTAAIIGHRYFYHKSKDKPT